MSFTSSGAGSGLRSAKAYTSVSGTSSHVGVSSVTSGSSVGPSSTLSANHQLAPTIAARYSALPDYDPAMRRAGDVFFHIDTGTPGHTNMVARDTALKIDSVDSRRGGGGVRSIPIENDHHFALVFRFFSREIALRAALIAEDWVGKVKYSDGASGSGVTFRAIGALFGSSKFGTGAQARLMKYRSRDGFTPKNVICSEMCVLAYQLAMREGSVGFPKLDAKHTLPTDLMKYFQGAGSDDWRVIARRSAPAPAAAD